MRIYHSREAKEWEKPLIIPFSHAGLWVASIGAFGRMKGFIKGTSLL
jgi:hypothetical protein